MNGEKIILAAHRGDRLLFPENTMPAFYSALTAGVDMIETDVHMTCDGHLVIIHDRDAKRTCGVEGNIDEMTLEQVLSLDAGISFNQQFFGTKVPTVEEFCQWVLKTDLLINWELKDYPVNVGDAHAFKAAELLCETVAKYGLTERSMINSFSARVLEHVAKKCPRRFPIHGQGIGNAPRSKDIPEMPFEELFDWCCLYGEEKGHSPVEYPDGFNYCISHGILPCVCISDEEESYKKAIALGCKMFTSNDIYTADKILRKLGVR